MNLQEHKKESSRTFTAPEYMSRKQIEQLHCVIGASTETGELLDAYKKSIYYNKPLDGVNVKEEIGDILWYLSNLSRLLNFDIEECLQMNISKLRERYPHKYSDDDATNRDLESERKILEKEPKSQLSDNDVLLRNPNLSKEQRKDLNNLLSLVDRFAFKMKSKLKNSIFKGRIGWDDSNSLEPMRDRFLRLASLVVTNPTASQEVDVANFAMFLAYHRDEFNKTIHKELKKHE